MDMYKDVTTRIRCTAGTSETFFVLLGGSVLSPLLFIIVINFLTSKLMQELLLSLLFADDVGLASERVAKIQEVFDKWKNILEDHGLRVSESKTQSFKYLGSIINKAGSCGVDVNNRISVAWLKWRE